jgi:hypothetical protein
MRRILAATAVTLAVATSACAPTSTLLANGGEAAVATQQDQANHTASIPDRTNGTDAATGSQSTNMYGIFGRAGYGPSVTSCPGGTLSGGPWYPGNYCAPGGGR